MLTLNQRVAGSNTPAPTRIIGQRLEMEALGGGSIGINTWASGGVAQRMAFALPVDEVEKLGGGFCVAQSPVMML